MIEILSTFGNTSILLLLSALLAAWLAREAGVRATLVWICVLALCVGVIAGLKIYFHGCPRPAFGLRSPSGKAGLSLFVRSEARRDGKESVSPCRSWWAPAH